MHLCINRAFREGTGVTVECKNVSVLLLWERERDSEPPRMLKSKQLAEIMSLISLFSPMLLLKCLDLHTLFYSVCDQDVSLSLLHGQNDLLQNSYSSFHYQ